MKLNCRLLNFSMKRTDIFFAEHVLIDMLVIQTFLTRTYRFLNKKELFFSENSTECFEFHSEKNFFAAYKLFQRVSCYIWASKDRVEWKQKCYKIKNSRLFFRRKVIMRTEGKKFSYYLYKVTWLVSVSWEQLYAPHFCFPFIVSFLI